MRAHWARAASGSPVPVISTVTGASTASWVRVNATGRRSSSAIAARTRGRAASGAKRETGAQRMTAVRARSSEKGPSGTRTWVVVDADDVDLLPLGASNGALLA